MPIILLFIFYISSVFAVDHYSVDITGNIDCQTLEFLKQHSRLISLQGSPPATIKGLERRANEDVVHLNKALQNLAFYKGEITPKIEDCFVTLEVSTGPLFNFTEVVIVGLPDCISICPSELGLTIGTPAFPKTILIGENRVLEILSAKGYPLAKIVDREVLVDVEKISLKVIYHVEPGSLALFGPVTIEGNKRVCEEFFYKKLAWCEGSYFDPCKIELTQSALEGSGLFSSIIISHDETLNEAGYLPMTIKVVESKFRSIGFGVSYMTQLGPGISCEWENRNVRNIGEKVSFRTNIYQDLKEATLVYVQPDRFGRDHNLTWLAEIEHEITQGFTESSLRVSGTIDRPLNKETRISYGLMYKYLKTTRSDGNGVYNLIKTPLQLRWSNADSLLDPHKGSSLDFRMTPSLQVLHPQFFYTINLLTGTYYIPLNKEKSFIIALKGVIGSILGPSRKKIPSSERFYAGSENTLRGYKYLTVSPLDDRRKPKGGRSMLIYTIEPRYQFTETLSTVVFYEIGQVYEPMFPEIGESMLQSLGVGLRYHTPVGPIRLDIAFPLNRRRHIDSFLQFYLSIGQAF